MKLHRFNAQSSNSCIIAHVEVNFSSCHASTSCHSLHRIAYVSNWSGIKYPRIDRKISKQNIHNINFKSTWPGSTLTLTLLQRSQVHLAVSLLVTQLITMKALTIPSWFSLSLGVRVWLGVLNFSLTLLLPRSTLLLEVRLVLNRHHMAAAHALLNVSLCCLKHAAELIQALFSLVHVVVRDEVPIAQR